MVEVERPVVEVITNADYIRRHPNSLFPEITDDSWYSPDHPDPLLTDLIHRGHRGHISFHRLSTVAKNKNGKPIFENLYSLKAKDVREHFAKIAVDLTHDSFFSINGMNRSGWRASKVRPEFNDALRNGNSVEFLTSCFVDIDCKTLGVTVGQAIGSIIDASDMGRIPKPSIFVRSGNGVWLFWLLRAPVDSPDHGEKIGGPIRAFTNRINTWTRIQHQIMNIFADIGADKNARDTARITRILGTMNSKASITSTVSTRSDVWLACTSQSGTVEVVAYTLEELATKFGVREDMDEVRWSAHPVAKLSDPRYRDRGIRGSKRLASIRLERFAKLLAHRNATGKKVPIGKRRAVALLYARLIHGAQEKKSIDIIAEHLGRLAYFGMEAGHGIHAFNAEREVLNTRGWERLRYSDLRIAEILEITENESIISGLPTIIQANASKLERDRRMSRPELRQRRYLLIRSLVMNSPVNTVHTIESTCDYLRHAHSLEVAQSTVARDIKLLLESEDNLSHKFGRKERIKGELFA